MKKLPIGIQNFRELIKGGYVYIDKTQYIHTLINSAKYYFLSRPRRFGKSLLLDTLAEVFGGDRELFKGLWIYNSDYEFKKHPVIRLDMSNISTKSADVLENDIMMTLRVRIQDEGFDIADGIPSHMFKRLIELLHRKYDERVVVLIDEYDKPILDHITDFEKADANRKVLRGFYGILKSMDPHLKFTMLTGVSKFTKTSVFSELNNLTDITLAERYANICGITVEDFDKHFGERIVKLSNNKRLKRYADIRGEILQWYDGYSWDGETNVLNPFSLLSFFERESFAGFWYNSGTPGFLVKLIKQDPGAYANIQGVEVTEGILNSGDIERISPVSLMFQSGYLTVKEVDYYTGGEPAYILDIPNFEVKEAFNLHVLAALTENDDEKTRTLSIDLRRALRSGDMDKALASLRRLFSLIPYEIHVDEDDYYHSIFFALMSFTGLDTKAEVSVADGRVDVIVEYDDKVYVMEFKHEKCDKEASSEVRKKLINETLSEGMKQIDDKGYCKPYIGGGKAIYKAVFAFIGRSNIEIRYEILEGA